ncbi:MAG: hypothetical protein OEY38_19815 [Gammaproteobacteria bacterium]|nr:hypothetical protein [Gammaproteobacteria bacterium]
MKLAGTIKKGLGVVILSATFSVVSADEFVNGFIAAQDHEYQLAASTWEPLARQGHAQAQFFLGMMYHSGIGGQLDEVAAVNLYHKAAENGNYNAQEYLAVAYREGWFGLKQSKKKARYWEKQLDQNPNR